MLRWFAWGALGTYIVASVLVGALVGLQAYDAGHAAGLERGRGERFTVAVAGRCIGWMNGQPLGRAGTDVACVRTPEGVIVIAAQQR